jgi:hypothetical protein
MKLIGRSVLVVWMIASLVASAAAQSSAFSAADSKELASYRLTMESVKKAHDATRAVFGEVSQDPKYQALMKVKKEIAELEKKEELTDAEQTRLDALREQAQQQEEALESNSGLNMSQANTLDEMEAQVKAFPPMVRALGKVGMTPREYSKFMLTMMMSAMVAGFQKSGVIKEIPPQLKEIHPDNVKFVLEHEAELQAMQKELERLGKGGN